MEVKQKEIVLLPCPGRVRPIIKKNPAMPSAVRTIKKPATVYIKVLFGASS